MTIKGKRTLARQHLGALIKEVRQSLHISLKRAAKMYGTTLSNWKYLEDGLIRPRNLEQLSEFLSIPIDILLRRSGYCPLCRSTGLLTEIKKTDQKEYLAKRDITRLRNLVYAFKVRLMSVRLREWNGVSLENINDILDSTEWLVNPKTTIEVK